MQVEVTKTEEVLKVQSNLGEIRGNKNDNSLIIEHDHYEIIITKRDTGMITITTKWLVIRPGHDHNNIPCVQVVIPKGGVCEQGPNYPKRDDEVNRVGQVIIHPDDGHWMMDLIYQARGYEPKVLFRLPSDVYHAASRAPRGKKLVKARQFSLMNIEKLLKEHGHCDAYKLIEEMMEGENDE